MSASLCLVEDDPTIRQFVASKLRDRGFSVDVYEESAPVLRDLETKSWDLFILDVLLPGDLSGLELCKRLRDREHTTPVLMLSALSDPADRIEGLKVGADDYLGKPFETEELLLRIDGMLKRRSWYGKLPRNSSQYEWNGCVIDFVKFEAAVNGKRFLLSQKECMLMKLLIEHEGEVVSRDEILDKVWGYNVFPSSRTVDNFILRLRRYFDNPGSPRYIHSVRGMGYKFTSEGQL
jgi:two-component system, OmpR family, alkaline phosphatase synthesis response regulator PhoP